METLHTMALHGIDAAMQPWHGFEYIWNQAKEHKPRRIGNREQLSNPMTFSFHALLEGNLAEGFCLAKESGL